MAYIIHRLTYQHYSSNAESRFLQSSHRGDIRKRCNNSSTGIRTLALKLVLLVLCSSKTTSFAPIVSCRTMTMTASNPKRIFTSSVPSTPKITTNTKTTISPRKCSSSTELNNQTPAHQHHHHETNDYGASSTHSQTSNRNNGLRAKQPPHPLSRNHNHQRRRRRRYGMTSTFSYQPVRVFLNGKVYNQHYGHNSPSSGGSTTVTPSRSNNNQVAAEYMRGNGNRKKYNSNDGYYTSTSSSTLLKVSSGFTFDDGDQLLVSASKPLGLILEECSNDNNTNEEGIDNIAPSVTNNGEKGCFVAQVVEGSAAQKAGVKVGDVLVAVQNADVTQASFEEVMERIGNAPRVVNLRFWRTD